MSAATIWTLAVFAVIWMPLAVLTLIGARRRGQRWRFAWLAGLAFPLTWAIWYVNDERAAGIRAARIERGHDL
ncbi:MAG TPA: hypothetical protein VFI65_32275 [Streptosporangiaceae bacterium]|nr:hypothetical protein [Streptosporangiaceae bacterium]